MGKLTAVLVGTAILLSFSYYVLAGSFSPLINWFGPVFGYRVNLLLGLTWLEEGTPLQYASIFIVWAIVGVIVGFSSKKIWGVFSTIGTIWWALVIVSIISVAAIFANIILGLRTISASSLSSLSSISFLPGVLSVPPGSNIYAILHEPVIIRYYDYFLSLVNSGTLTQLLSSSGHALLTPKNEKILEDIGLFLIAGPIEAYIIMVAFGITTLSLKRRYIGPKKEKKVKGKKKNVEKLVAILIISLVVTSSSSLLLNDRMNEGGQVLSAANTNISLEEVSSISSVISHSYSSPLGNIVSSILSSAVGGEKGQGANAIAMPETSNNSPASSPISLGNVSGGAGISVVTGNGNLYNIYGLLNYSGAPAGYFSFPAFSNSEFSITILQSNIYQLAESFASSLNLPSNPFTGSLNSPGNTSINFYDLINLLPNFLYIVGYNGSLSATNQYATEAASYISSNLGILAWGRMFSFNTNSLSALTKSNITLDRNLSLYIYAGYTDFKSSATRFSNRLLGQITTDANENLMRNSIDSGYIVPGTTSASATSSLIISGQINSRYISTYLNAGSLKNYSYLAKSGIFALDLSYWGHRFHSTGSHSIAGANLFDYNGPLNITQNGDISIFGFGVEHSSALNTSSPLSNVNLSIFINNATLASYLKKSESNSSGTGVTAIPAGPFYLSQYSVTSNVTFPANLTESVKVKNLNANKVSLTFTIWNNDTAPVTNLNISLKQFFSTYGATLKITGNLPETIVIENIAPGQYYSFSYVLSVYGTGKYYIPPPQVSYLYEGRTFVTQVGSTYTISGQAPSVAYAVTSSIISLLNLAGDYKPLKSLASLATFHLGPLNIVELVILLLIVLDVYIEYRAFRRWRESKKPPSVQPVPPGPVQSVSSDQPEVKK